MVAWGEFLFYSNQQLIKFEKEKRFGLNKQFCNYEKREIKTFENFHYEFLRLRYIIKISMNLTLITKKDKSWYSEKDFIRLDVKKNPKKKLIFK